MDLNLVMISGRLAAPPELRTFESGTRLARYLVTTRRESPRRRVDVIPVTLWNPSEELLDTDPSAGRIVWVAGSVQRRFWDAAEGRRSRLEVVAEHVAVRPDTDREPDAGVG